MLTIPNLMSIGKYLCMVGMDRLVSDLSVAVAFLRPIRLIELFPFCASLKVDNIATSVSPPLL